MNEFSGLDEVTTDHDVADHAGDDERRVVAIPAQKKRRPFAYWKVGQKELKLKLNASVIQKIEGKFKNRSLLSLIMDTDGAPALSIMLTVIQGAAIPWQHGTSYADIEHMFDEWVDSGEGNQSKLLTDVVMPILIVSGFFTPEQVDAIEAELKEQQ